MIVFHNTSYLHQNKIVHGNVSLATIFIQHNGLVKIGSGTWDINFAFKKAISQVDCVSCRLQYRQMLSMSTSRQSPPRRQLGSTMPLLSWQLPDRQQLLTSMPLASVHWRWAGGCVYWHTVVTFPRTHAHTHAHTHTHTHTHTHSPHCFLIINI